MIELVEVLSEAGQRTGRTKPKDEVHRDGDWHLAVHLWIVMPDDRVLLQRRALTKASWPGLWDISVAGHVSAGESAIDAVLRETREELGLAVDPRELQYLGRLRYHAVLHDGAYVENEFHEVFLMRREIDVEALRLDPEEVAEVQLVAPGDLDTYAVVRHPESYALLRANLSRTTT